MSMMEVGGCVRRIRSVLRAVGRASIIRRPGDRRRVPCGRRLQGSEPELLYRGTLSGMGAGAAETGSEPELAQKSQVLTGPTYPIFSTK